MTVAILAEKPSAARAIAAALGGARGSYQGTDYVIVNARGHLLELAQPEDQVPGADASEKAKLRSWNLSDLPWDLSRFSWKQVPGKDTAALLRDIKTGFSSAEEICIATDFDPSGEGGLIAANIIKHLGFEHKKISRMYFTDESPASFQKGFISRKPIPKLDDFDEYRMSSFRNAWDFASIQFTRVATSAAAQSSVLRQGRLKSAMVLLVGDQLKAHNDYVKTSMFQSRFRDENGVLYANPDEARYATEAEVPKTYSASAVVVDATKMKSTAPPKLLDLAKLSARLSKKGFNADVVLKTYQAMYEATVVSYPRTEDKTITNEQFKELLPLVDKIAGVVGVDPAKLTNRAPRKTHVKDVGAHGANRPGLKVPSSLEELKGKFGPAAPYIYAELARSFLAMLAEDYQYEAQEGHIQDYPDFKGRASVPKSLGWKEVFITNDKSSDDEDENSKGLGTRGEPVVHEIIPPRPEHPSMDWLMNQLDKREVGTGATRSSTYAELTRAQSVKNKYPLMVDKRGKVTFTEFGEQSYRMLPGTNIGDLGMTERVFATMKEIAAGNADMDTELAKVADWVKQDIETMRANGEHMRKELGLEEVKQVKEKAEGVWKGEQIRFSREWSGHRFSDQEVSDLLAGKTIYFTATSARTGNDFEAKGKLERQTFNGHEYVGFKADFGGIPKVFLKRPFTDEEIAKLEAGEKVFVTGLYSQKKDKNFDATVYYDKKADKLQLEFGK